MRGPTLFVLCIAIALTSAQLATEIGDGQIQALTSIIPILTPTPTPTPTPAEAPKGAIPNPAPPPPPPAEHATISPPPQPAPAPVNTTFPAPPPAPVIPPPAPKEEVMTAPPSPITANISITHTFSSSTCTGTAALAPAGNNATAPTVPAAPSVVDAAPTEGRQSQGGRYDGAGVSTGDWGVLGGVWRYGGGCGLGLPASSGSWQGVKMSHW
ncbi:hypothetical protein ABVK25_009274 [Lepraria finkii]|uniref:Uncharacterized protein n=1 Tax=Lepraria finkii TaxID=1340010 RepID=A0ABR4AY89_9LECA